VEPHAGGDEHDRVAVGLGVRGRGRGDHAAAADAALDHDRLAEHLGHRTCEQARDDIRVAARVEALDEPDRLCGPGLRRHRTGGCGRDCRKSDRRYASHPLVLWFLVERRRSHERAACANARTAPYLRHG
jgi:hypothetical protein